MGSLLLVGALACPAQREPAQAALSRIAAAQEDYALADYYALSRRFLKTHPEHPEADRIRYELAAQLIAENLKRPDSTEAKEARALLRAARERAKTEDRRFEAALLLMKFEPQGSPESSGSSESPEDRAEALLKAFPAHPDLDQVYLWVIDQLIAQKKLQRAAAYSERLLARPSAQGNPMMDRPKAIVRRAKAALSPFPWPEGFEAPRTLTLVDFWASWCAPCVQAIPDLVALRARFGEDLGIVGVNMDEAPAAAAPYLETMPWPQLQDAKHKLSDKLGIESLPAYVLIDGEGRILSMELSRPELAQAIEAALERP